MSPKIQVSDSLLGTVGRKQFGVKPQLQTIQAVKPCIPVGYIKIFHVRVPDEGLYTWVIREFFCDSERCDWCSHRAMLTFVPGDWQNMTIVLFTYIIHKRCLICQ